MWEKLCAKVAEKNQQVKWTHVCRRDISHANRVEQPRTRFGLAWSLPMIVRFVRVQGYKLQLRVVFLTGVQWILSVNKRIRMHVMLNCVKLKKNVNISNSIIAWSQLDNHESLMRVPCAIRVWFVKSIVISILMRRSTIRQLTSCELLGSVPIGCQTSFDTVQHCEKETW